jgi:CubicO group peptidase (beta-lactamase class C family)
MQSVLEGHVTRGAVPGLVWLIARGDDVRAGALGVRDVETRAPMTRDTLFRISSMTKPVTAVAALILLEECRLRLDDPVDELLPELADRRVLAVPGGSLDATVPAARPVTVRDLLTSRLGLGMDFSGAPQPSMARLSASGLNAGPPAPARNPGPDGYLKLLGSVPLEHQPGERWMYHTSYDVLGALVGRASGTSYDAFLTERLLTPLGMRDTGFAVPNENLARFGPSYATDPGSGVRALFDPSHGQWATPPAFPGGGDGLVSTADDFLRFAEILRRGGRPLLSRASVAAMTVDHLTPQQHAAAGPDQDGALGWGFGVGVQLRRTGLTRSPGSYGWDGGMGTTWCNDPAEDLIAILMTNQMWTSPNPPPVARDFLTCAYTALDA